MIKFYFSLLISQLFFLYGISQQVIHTIDYAYLSLTGCNIFASSTTISNAVHLTTLGRPGYLDNSVLLKSQTQDIDIDNVTVYSIAFNFKAGYNYKIAVNQRGVKAAGDPYPANIGLKFSTDNGGTDDGTQCFNGLDQPKSVSSTYIQGLVSESSNYVWINLVDANLTQSYSHLLVAAIPNEYTQFVGDTYIRKIQIIETPPPYPFVITPGTLALTCGTNNGQIFTATNPLNLTGITNYKWNLGPAPNGWQVNGSPAPSFINSGTNNTILLVPSCGTPLSTISVTATVGGADYGSNVIQPTISQPTYIISGPNTLCATAGIYSIPNLPCNASVAWSATPSNSVTLTPIGNEVSVQTNGATGGNVTLTATVTSCGVSTPVLKQVSIDYLPAATQMFFNGVAYSNFEQNLCVNGGGMYYDIFINPIGGASSYSWNIDAPPGAVTLNSGQGTSIINVTINGSQGTFVRFSVQAVNTCGYGSTTQAEGLICGVIIPPSFTVSPNPTTGDVQIASINKKLLINEIQVIDKYGNLKKWLKIGRATEKHKISIADLPADVYMIRVYDGTKWTTTKVIKK